MGIGGVTIGLFVLCSIILPAQTDRSSYGIWANAVITQHNADFRAFPGVPSCCPAYQGGWGSGIGAGILYTVPLSDNLRIALRGGYVSFGATLSREEATTVDGNRPGIFEHQVKAVLADVGAEPLISYQPFSSLPSFWCSAGFRAGWLLSKNYSQKESILQPTDGVFPHGSSTQNEVHNEVIPESASIYASALLGLSYDLPLNTKGTMILAPELLYSLGLTPIVHNLTWSVNCIRAGVAIRYSPLPYKEPLRRIERKNIIDTVQRVVRREQAIVLQGRESITSAVQETEEEILTTETLRRTDTMLVPKTNMLRAALKINSVFGDGNEQALEKVSVEEFTSSLMTPLLNFVFFDENSSTIPPRYKQLRSSETSTFREDKVNDPDRLQAYHQVLNIIGSRMKTNTSATLTVLGCNADIAAEKGNLELSRRRAEEVKNYLVNTWNIPEKRIEIQARNLRDRAANSQTNDGAQENRCVEFLSDTPTILAPLVSDDTLRTVAPNMVRFRPQVSVAEQPVDTWSLIITQGSTTLRRFEGKAPVPEAIDWNIHHEEASRPRLSLPLVCRFTISTAANDSAVAEQQLPAEQITVQLKRKERRADKEINRYSLVLFNVRSTEITDANKSIIELIKKDITPTSTVRLTGYTDRTGDLKSNQALAEGRANNTAKALGIALQPENIQGIANASTYNPELPEGRIYTRTVDVIIETPVQSK